VIDAILTTKNPIKTTGCNTIKTLFPLPYFFRFKRGFKNFKSVEISALEA